MAVKDIAAAPDLMITPGAPGVVVESWFLGSRKRVQFTLENEVGQRRVIVAVKWTEVC
ncbi:hypothetical protein BH11ACT6_BH11ACT6_07790 [soil metagenome]